jgi:tRNA (guanine-N7-)-methyltransferase
MTTIQRNLYGRRRGPKLRDNRAELMRNRLGHYAALSDSGDDTLDLRALFPDQDKTWLEVGFGAGEHVAAQARQNPDVGILACEHYLNGVASCLAHLEKDALTNVRVHNGDARDLMDRLPDASLDRVFVLYPDPWPKARHHKRRFINPENLDAFSRIMADGATLRVASDIPDYIDWTLEHLAARDDFTLSGNAEGGFREAWPDWPGTRYEAKALREGRTPAYLTFTRNPR